MGLGVALSMAGYRYRKTDFGAMGMGIGSSITGAGIVLLILDFAGLRSENSGS